MKRTWRTNRREELTVAAVDMAVPAGEVECLTVRPGEAVPVVEAVAEDVSVRGHSNRETEVAGVPLVVALPSTLGIQTPLALSVTEPVSFHFIFNI